MRDDRTQTSAFLSLAFWILSCYTSTRDVWYHLRNHSKNKLYATYALNGGNNHLTTTTQRLFPVMWDPVVSTALLCNRILCYSCPWVLLTRNKLALWHAMSKQHLSKNGRWFGILDYRSKWRHNHPTDVYRTLH